jgi:Skp family chaperone for outer membrane proteins
MNQSSCRSSRSKWLIIVVALLLCVSSTVAQDDDYDFVKEVLDEDQENYADDIYEDEIYEDAPETHEEEMLRKQQEAELKRKEEKERIAREKADRIQEEREAAFAAEVAKMSDEQQKVARKQKKVDARIVRRILRAAKNDNHYAVLGLRNWELQTPSRTIKLASLVFRIPGFALFHISPKAIKKAYRKLAMTVHPDKNLDGRATEAFIAVENSASILTDETKRVEYDDMVREIWRERREIARKKAVESVDGTLHFFGRIVQVFRRVLGPFAFPVFILGCLLI